MGTGRMHMHAHATTVHTHVHGAAVHMHVHGTNAHIHVLVQPAVGNAHSGAHGRTCMAHMHMCMACMHMCMRVYLVVKPLVAQRLV